MKNLEKLHIGFVDKYENLHISGWSYNPKTSKQTILITIDSTPIKKIASTKLRPDVAAAGFAPEQCGFEFSINLESLPKRDCIISISDPLTGNPLSNGTLLFSNGELVLATQKNQGRPKLTLSEYISAQQIERNLTTPNDIVNEFFNKLSEAPKGTFIAMAYLTILGRTPDQDGFSNKIKYLENSLTAKKNLIKDMINSTEFKSKRTLEAAFLDIQKIPNIKTKHEENA